MAHSFVAVSMTQLKNNYLPSFERCLEVYPEYVCMLKWSKKRKHLRIYVGLEYRVRALFLFFVSRRFASRIHEISDLKKALVLSLEAEYTRLRDQKKTY